jgi:hypothetical protein
MGHHEPVRRVLVDLQLGTWYQFGGLDAGDLERRGGIRVSVDQQRRDSDLPELSPEVGVERVSLRSVRLTVKDRRRWSDNDPSH